MLLLPPRHHLPHRVVLRVSPSLHLQLSMRVIIILLLLSFSYARSSVNALNRVTSLFSQRILSIWVLHSSLS